MSYFPNQGAYTPMPPSAPRYFDPNAVQFNEFSYDQNSIFTPMPSEVRQDEDYDNEPPLLEELGVDFSRITGKTIAVLFPYRVTTEEVLHDADLCGPLIFCILFGFSLLLAGKLHFNYIYGLGMLSCFGIYFLLSMMTPKGIALTCVASTLGYCLLPMCLFSGAGLLFPFKNMFGVVASIVAVLWCSMASSNLFVRALDMQHQRILVAYPCALVYSVFALIVVF